MAKLYVQSLLDAKQKLGGLPLDLEQLFDDAYAQGARIHNNSWGALSGSEYRLRALEVDRYVWQHRDMLIVFSAGNAGTDSDPQLGPTVAGGISRLVQPRFARDREERPHRRCQPLRPLAGRLCRYDVRQSVARCVSRSTDPRRKRFWRSTRNRRIQQPGAVQGASQQT